MDVDGGGHVARLQRDRKQREPQHACRPRVDVRVLRSRAVGGRALGEGDEEAEHLHARCAFGGRGVYSALSPNATTTTTTPTSCSAPTPWGDDTGTSPAGAGAPSLGASEGAPSEIGAFSDPKFSDLRSAPSTTTTSSDAASAGAPAPTAEGSIGARSASASAGGAVGEVGVAGPFGDVGVTGPAALAAATRAAAECWPGGSNGVTWVRASAPKSGVAPSARGRSRGVGGGMGASAARTSGRVRSLAKSVWTISLSTASAEWRRSSERLTWTMRGSRGGGSEGRRRAAGAPGGQAPRRT